MPTLIPMWLTLPPELLAIIITMIPKWFRPLVGLTCRSWHAVVRDLPCERFIAYKAAEYGWLNVLKWAHAHGCPLDRYKICFSARNHLDIMMWLKIHGCPYIQWTCYIFEKVRGIHLFNKEWKYIKTFIDKQSIDKSSRKLLKYIYCIINNICGECLQYPQYGMCIIQDKEWKCAHMCYNCNLSLRDKWCIYEKYVKCMCYNFAPGCGIWSKSRLRFELDKLLIIINRLCIDDY